MDPLGATIWNLSPTFRRLMPLAVGLAVLACIGVSCRRASKIEGKSVRDLEQMLRTGAPADQAAAAFGLSLRGPEARSAVPALIAALRSPDALVRQNSALALGAIGPDAREAAGSLVGALADSEWTVRRQAALALGQIGASETESVAALQKLLRDEHPLVRQAAGTALADLTKKKNR